MTDKEIIIAAVKKASENGYKREIDDSDIIHIIEFYDFEDGDNTTLTHWCHDRKIELYISIRDIIFSHDFAKSFFGSYNKQDLSSNIRIGGEFKCMGTTKVNGLEKHEYHLQQMVISENPIQYLKDFLK